MKTGLFFVLVFLISLQSFSQIIPKIELDYISTVSGKKYSGIIQSNSSDSIFIKVNSKLFQIAKSQIDTLDKHVINFPFIKDSPYSEIKLIPSMKTIQGDVVSFTFPESIKFFDIKTGKNYNLNWSEFIDLKTMDPDYLKYDVIIPLFGNPIKGEFLSVIDEKRFTFSELNGKAIQYHFRDFKNIYLKDPEHFLLPEKFRSKFSKSQQLSSNKLRSTEFITQSTNIDSSFAININRKIIPKIETDYISTFSGKKYSGFLTKNDSDSLSIKVNGKEFSIAKTQIDTLEKRTINFPFIENSPFSEIKLATSKRISGNIIEFDFLKNIIFYEVKTGQTYDLKWHEFSDLKTMDPDFLKYDFIFPSFKNPLKGEFISIIDDQRFIFKELNGKPTQYFFQDMKDIYLLNPQKFQLPEKFSHKPEPNSKSNFVFAISGGISFPINNFNSTTIDGKTSIGYNINADCYFPVNNYILLGVSFYYQSFSNEIGNSNLYNYESDNWSNVWILGGTVIKFNPTQKSAFFSLHGGILLSSFPSINYTSKSNYSKIKAGTITGESDASYAFSAGVGYMTERVFFAAKFLASNPEFTIKDSSFPNSKATGEIDISTFTLSLGFRF